MKRKNIKIFCTLGPSSLNRDTIVKLDNLGVDMFRINLSHTDAAEIERVILKIRRYTEKPICLDTEGAQIRVCHIEGGRAFLREGDIVEVAKDRAAGNPYRVSFTPPSAIGQIMPGDLISVDFDSVLLKATYCTPNLVKTKVISGGYVCSNKAVTIDRDIALPTISEKDRLAVNIGLRHGITHYALSFAGSAASVKEFRKIAGKRSHIISKIESKNGVRNLDEILTASDSILIDRGDLSREEPIENIPFIQKMIVKKANRRGVPVYIATNLLESMVKSKAPTRAEMNDVVNTLLDGADGLVLAAETAIGSYPVNCAMMISKTIKRLSTFSSKNSLEELQRHESFLLAAPHGGTLINRIMDSPDIERIKRYKRLKVDRRVLLDAEQIAIGTFSPLKGFMKKKEVESVIKNYRLPNGIVWPLPITLQADKSDVKRLGTASDIALAAEGSDDIYAVLRLEEIYSCDLDKLAINIFGTSDMRHPGVRALKESGNYFLGGTIDLLKRLPSPHKHYEITPKQARAIFENKGWSRVVGFHTRNAIHRIHEHIQKLSIEKYNCDGIFVHPVVGPKKSGDYAEEIILKSYELMIDKYYPRGKVVLGAFQSYSRYAGPREAVFTAICRKNFGCSHFIVGRDHTGLGGYYRPYDVHELFNRLGDIGIVPIFFREMNYCRACDKYVDRCAHSGRDVLSISGSKAREMLRAREPLPEWFMRKDISEFIRNRLKKGEEVFIS